ncbi:MAG TPA: hypothetical protein VGG64_17825 [Pirellulales bacterium]
MSQLFEQYRPQSWGDVVGQAAAIAKIDTVRQRGLAGRAWWISGRSGTGKSTIAKLLALEVADEFGIEEFDASELNAARLRELRRSQATRGWGDKGGRAVIVNEAHGLRADAIRELLVMLEALPRHVLWAFTTTLEGQLDLLGDHIDASPLLSRCTLLELNGRELELSFALRVRQIAQAEKLDGRPIDVYVALAKKHKCNMRAMLNDVESGELLAR